MLKILGLFLMLILSGCSSSHYYDQFGNSLEKFDTVWEKLFQFYGSSLPEKITVSPSFKNYSYFGQANDIYIKYAELWPVNFLIAHESSHLALMKMMNEANVTEPFRFVDEGVSSWIAEKFINDEADFRAKAFEVATNNKKITLDDLQKWSQIFGDWQTSTNINNNTNRDPYYISATLIYYFIDKFSESQLKLFLIDIGKTKDLAKSLDNVFHKSKDEIENEWKEYVDEQFQAITNPPPDSEPLIISMQPYKYLGDVDSNIGEIFVKFNVPMQKKVCVIAECEEICYTNAYWKDDRTLAVKLPNKLKKDKIYTVGLGNDRTKCYFESKAGKQFKTFSWKFKTKD